MKREWIQFIHSLPSLSHSCPPQEFLKKQSFPLGFICFFIWQTKLTHLLSFYWLSLHCRQKRGILFTVYHRQAEKQGKTFKNSAKASKNNQPDTYLMAKLWIFATFLFFLLNLSTRAAQVDIGGKFL